MSPPKRRLTFNGLHDVISQKIKLIKLNVVYFVREKEWKISARLWRLTNNESKDKFCFTKLCYFRYTRNEILNIAMPFPRRIFITRRFYQHEMFVQPAIKVWNKTVNVYNTMFM
jgi:hypothetical protein